MKKFFSIVFLCAVAVSAMAVPARRDGMIRTNAEGKQITVYQHGDELFHYLTNEAGEWIEEDEQGNYQVVPALSEAEIADRRGSSKFASVHRAPRAQEATGVDRMLGPRGALILVSYADNAFSTSDSLMHEWAMGEDYNFNGATGSIHQYFMDQSWGNYDLQLDIFGPVTVSKNASYYGANDSRGNDKHADELVREACILAHDSLGADFSQYDYDDDGYADWVVVIYAGKGEADGGAKNTIWPHQYNLSYSGKQVTLDGKIVDRYCCLNELQGSNKCSGIGTFCHEFSHVLGLPDLYSTNEGSTHKTMGKWDLMDYGCYNNNSNTPSAYSAYERWWMGWLEPELMADTVSVKLPLLNNSQEALYVTESGLEVTDILNPSPSTFYVLENREKSGWDKYLPGKGMLITKIKFSSYKWMYNTVNNDANNMGVDLIEADGKAPSYGTSISSSGWFGKAKDAFPAGADSCTVINNYRITNIKFDGNVITFDVNGGKEEEEPVGPRQGVEQVTDVRAARKIIRDGMLVIVRGKEEYNILGKRL